MRFTMLVVVALSCATVARAQSVFVEDLTWPEIRDAMAAGKTTAIVYAGGLEQNGPHMALAKHNLIARQVAARVAEQLGNALVYPVMPFSPAGDAVERTGHMRFPGTVSLSPDVFLGAMRQIALSALAAGFKQVYLMGDHGQGLAELRVAAEGLDADWRRKGARVHFIDTQAKATQQMNAYMKERGITPGGHAGVAETAQVMSVDARQIRRDKYAQSAAGPEPAAGVLVDPTPATADMGRMFLDMKVAAAVEQIRAAATQK
jgi:creatinine amidohydrolase/Fe(II)-dependent formamide hydrolase-like protein